jgi:hypothetical protein
MCNKYFSSTKRSILMSVLFFESVFQICCASESQGPLPKDNMDRIKKVYEFEKWAGKVKNQNLRIEKLEIDPNIFDIFSSGKRIIRVNSKEITLSFKDKKTDLDVKIDILLCSDSNEAHKNIIEFLSVSSAVPPTAKRINPNEPNNPLNIGDVCFVPINQWFPGKSKKPALYDLIFTRNNAFVILRNSNDETKEEYPDLGEIAKFIDKKLIVISKTKEEKK